MTEDALTTAKSQHVADSTEDALATAWSPYVVMTEGTLATEESTASHY